MKSVILQMNLFNESLSVTVIDLSGGTVSLPHHKNIFNIKKMFFFLTALKNSKTINLHKSSVIVNFARDKNIEEQCWS